MSIVVITIKTNNYEISREMEKESFTIGRGADCDIPLNDFHVSRVHLLVTVNGDKIIVEDKKSSNGSFLNGKKIKPLNPVKVNPADKVQLGQSEYILSFDFKSAFSKEPALDTLPEPIPTEIPKASSEPSPKSDLSVKETASLSVSTAAASGVSAVPVSVGGSAQGLTSEPSPTPKSTPIVEDTVDLGRPNISTSEAEQILHEAKKKAAQIVLEGEKQAEKRVQAIYQTANEKRDQAQQFYQNRIAEAHKDADAILLDFQNQGRTLLQDARVMAQELRDEVDDYVRSLKERTLRESEDLIAKAKQTAEKVKSDAVEQGREKLQVETEEIQKNLKNKTEALKTLSAELADVEKNLSFSKSLLEEARALDAEIRQKSKTEEEKFKNRLRDEENLLKDIHDKEQSRLKDLVDKEEAKVSELQERHKLTLDEHERLENRIRSLQERQVQFDRDLVSLAEKKEGLEKDYETQKKILNEKLESEKQKIDKSEQQYQEEVRLETSKRLQKIEQEFLDSLINKKESLIKKVYAVLEKNAITVIEADQWKKISQDLENQVKAVVDEEIVTSAKSTVSLQKPVDLIKKKERERMGWLLSGLVAGVCVLFVGQVIVRKLSRNKAPIQNLVEAETKKRQEDLEKRRFNPQQVDELKDSYTDAVIYTKNFVQVYTDEQFQQTLYKELSVYLLKTWRIDEDKSIQLIAVANALVKSLEEKRKQIHPDFINDGIKKMHDLEAEASVKMKDILGSEVRLESFRTFERDFYKSYQAKTTN